MWRMVSVWQAVAIDYDGTLTQGRRPEPDVLAAVREARAEGHAMVLVTGRILSELRADFPEVDDEFDAIVAENGAVLADVDGTRDLAAPVKPELAWALAHRDVVLRRGRVLLACDAAHAATALEEVGRLGLDCQLTRNRAALMIMPAGVTKGTGLAEALGNLGISRHSVIAVGNAENDHTLLEACELGVAVANAVDSLKRHADLVLDEPDGAGMAGLLRGPVLDGSTRVEARRWQLEVGHTAGGDSVRLPASGVNVLITGGSGSGKSYLTGLLAEQLTRLEYSILVVDCEGDHVDLATRRGVLGLGGHEDLPEPHQLTRLLRHRVGSVVLDLSLLDADAQRSYLAAAAPLVLAQRAATGLPHWIFLDEAHTIPDDAELRTQNSSVGATGYCYTTYRPEDLPPVVRDRLDYLIVTAGGNDGREEAIAFAAHASGHTTETIAERLGDKHRDALVLHLTGDTAPAAVRVAARTTRHIRHWHKYVNASLPPRLRFYFHDGGEVSANLREFHRHLASCPTETLTYHLARSDVSRWLAHVMADRGIAATVARIEAQSRSGAVMAEDARQAIRSAIEARYLEWPDLP